MHKRRASVTKCFELVRYVYRQSEGETKYDLLPIEKPTPSLFASLWHLMRHAKENNFGEEIGHISERSINAWLLGLLAANMRPTREKPIFGYGWRQATVLFFPDRKTVGFLLPHPPKEVRVLFPPKRNKKPRARRHS